MSEYYIVERKNKNNQIEWVVMRGNCISNEWIHKTRESAEKYKLELEILFGGWKSDDTRP
ncbi:MAG: hypothetical protein OEV78_12950 [Spirochaetia bacterium]|nr:hypothetical protein [Spirochaetia bacterium]